MIDTITLTCFRQHISRTFNFTKGLNLLRGENEGGKTTILEAFSYALGGATTLAEPLADVVTWGHNENELAVSLTIVILGVPYTFDRSTRGATVNSPGLDKKITGQREVTAFAGELLGGSMKTLSLLLMASQSGLQDVITAGPGEVSGLVAKLGSLDVIDNVIKTAGLELVTGNEKVHQDRLATLESTVEELSGTGPQPAEIEALKSGHDQLTTDLKSAEDAVENVWEPAMSVTHIELDRVNAALEAHRLAASDVTACDADVRTTLEGIYQAESVMKVDPSAMEVARAEVAHTQAQTTNLSVHRALNALPTIARLWDTDSDETGEQSLRKAIAAADERLNELTVKVTKPILSVEMEAQQRGITNLEKGPLPNAEECAALRVDADKPYKMSELERLESQRRELADKLAVASSILAKGSRDVQGDTCPTCGQAFADAEARRAHNEALHKEVADAKQTMLDISTQMQAVSTDIKLLKQEASDYRLDLLHRAETLEEAGRRLIADAVAVMRVEYKDMQWRASQYTANLIDKVTAARRERDSLQSVMSSAAPALAFVAKHGDNPYVSVDHSTCPPQVTWTGPDASNADALLAKAKSALSQLEAQEQAYQRAQGALEGLRSQLAAQSERQARMVERLASMPQPDTTEVQTRYDQLSKSLEEARVKVNELKAQVNESNARILAYNARMQRHEQTVAHTKAQRDEAKRALEELQWNNQFLKVVKGLKPIVTEHMWGKALSSISNFFSSMRDEQAVVTRENGVFLFNGKPASSLSGSGKDILALAIRTALSMCFIPNVGFISLDEPAHGSDENRTSKILGFLASCGYEQIILASHDPLSEAVADNIIYVREAA